MKTTNKSTLLASVLIITLITISSVHAQYSSRFFYNNRRGNTDDEASDGKSAVDDADTNVKFLEESNAIPLDLLQEMGNVSDLSEFIDKFVAADSIDPKFGIHHKFSEGNVERAALTKATPANCIPENTVVPLEPLNRSKDPSLIYYPQCTRVKRCGGCCPSVLLECQPVEVETITFTILKLQYVSNRKPMKIVGQEPVLVEEHKRCNCSCVTKKEHCNSNQVYDASQCKCKCTNYNARDKCFAEDDKIWDYEKCECRCRESQQCTTGTYFDEQLCKCIEIYGSNSTSVLQNRRRFIVKAIPVEPSNETVYDTGKRK